MEKHFSAEKIPEFLYPKKESEKNHSIVYMTEDIVKELRNEFKNWFIADDISPFEEPAGKNSINLMIFALSPDEENNDYSSRWKSLCSLLEEFGSETENPCFFLNGKAPGIMIISPSVKETEKAAVSISKTFREINDTELLCGISYYPCLEYEFEDILTNGFKALVHASMLETEKTAVFDSVSLNISSDEFFQKKDIENAVKELELALMLNDKDANVLNSLGVCFAIKKDFDKSIHYFSRACDLSPGDFVMPLYNLGLVHYLKNEKEKAQTIFHKAAGSDTVHYEIPFYLGKTEFDSKNYSKALSYFKRAEALKPDSPAVLNYIGEIYLINKDYDNSYYAYKKSLKYMPDNPYALSAIGYIYLIKGENKEIAETFIRESIEFEPDNPVFKERLKLIEDEEPESEDSELARTV